MNTSDPMGLGGRHRSRRRRHTDEFKAMVVAACRRPGVSIASVALAQGLNANMLRRWLHDAEVAGECSTSPPAPSVVIDDVPSALTPAFVQLPVAVSSPVPPTPVSKPTGEPASIFVEVQRADTSIYVTWPTSAAADAAAWLRELLR